MKPSEILTKKSTIKVSSHFNEFQEFRTQNIKKLDENFRRSEDISVILNELSNHITDEEKKQANSIQAQIDNYSKLSEDLIRRLKKTNLEIAVIGREKAGKSSLINGWLGVSLLPNDSKRCTYTTTEIISCENENEQKLVIEYLKTVEFDEYKKSLELEGENASHVNKILLESELNEIKEYEAEIRKYLDKEAFKKEYISIKEMAQDAYDAITRPGQARAVKSVKLWTPKLFEKKNITFIDKPGYDSPHRLHKDQTKNKIEELDVVIFAKQMTSPSIVDCEQEMLNLVSQDRLVPIKDKTIIVLTQADKPETPEKYEACLKEAYKEWAKFGITNERIVPVCAALALNEITDDKKAIEMRIQNLIGFPKEQGNMDALRMVVENYAINSRQTQLKKLCDDLSSFFQRIIDATIKLGDKVFPYDKSIDDYRRNMKSEKNRLFNQWWAKKWNSILKEFKLFYQFEFFEKHNYFEKFAHEYSNLINEINANSITTMSPQEQIITYHATAHHTLNSASEGHLEIRKKLTEEVYKYLNTMSTTLTDVMIQAIDEILNWIDQNMWSIKEIRESLFDDHRLLLSASLKALILTHARPAIDLFLRYPRFDNRKNTIQAYMRDVISYDLYYKKNGTNEQRYLAIFLANGTWASSNPFFDNYKGLEFDVENLTFSPRPDKIDEVIKEINEDLDAFKDYMQNSIYYLAGLEEFFKQELNKICLNFENEEKNSRRWHTYVCNSIENGNVIFQMPDFDKEFEKRLKLMEEFDELKKILKQYSIVKK